MRSQIDSSQRVSSAADRDRTRETYHERERQRLFEPLALGEARHDASDDRVQPFLVLSLLLLKLSLPLGSVVLVDVEILGVRRRGGFFVVCMSLLIHRATISCSDSAIVITYLRLSFVRVAREGSFDTRWPQGPRSLLSRENLRSLVLRGSRRSLVFSSCSSLHGGRRRRACPCSAWRRVRLLRSRAARLQTHRQVAVNPSFRTGRLLPSRLDRARLYVLHLGRCA